MMMLIHAEWPRAPNVFREREGTEKGSRPKSVKGYLPRSGVMVEVPSGAHGFRPWS